VHILYNAYMDSSINVQLYLAFDSEIWNELNGEYFYYHYNTSSSEKQQA